MIITIEAHVNNRKGGRVEWDMFGNIHVYTSARPIEGLANESIIKILSEYYKVSKSCVILKSGATSKIKKFEILN